MKTRTVVELDNKEFIDSLIATAKKAIQPAAGSIHVEIRNARGEAIEDATALVIFEWGAKVRNGE